MGVFWDVLGGCRGSWVAQGLFWGWGGGGVGDPPTHRPIGTPVVHLGVGIPSVGGVQMFLTRRECAGLKERPPKRSFSVFLGSVPVTILVENVWRRILRIFLKKIQRGIGGL